LFGAVVAHADPAFVLTQSGAGPGDMVQFSISGPDGRGTYSLEVDGREVAEGSVPADSSISAAFTMPDFGATSKAVTVEAQITQSDETTTREREFRYLAPSQASAGPPAPALPPVATAAPAARSAPASDPAPPSRRHKRPARRTAPVKRHAARPPERAPQRYLTSPRHSAQLGARGSPVSASPVAPAGTHSPRTEKPPSITGPHKRRPPARHESIGQHLKTFLTGPPTPAIFSLATSGVQSNAGDGAPVTAWIVLFLLGLTALSLAGPGLTPRRRPTRRRGRPRSRRQLQPDPSASAEGSSAPPIADVEDPEAQEARFEEAATSFAPIPLAALDAQATLATRSERKYILDPRTFDRLIGEIAPHYLILEIDGARVFSYDTVYFDTPELSTYLQHVQGRRKRFKCRTRLYAESELCFFEVKLKGGRGETIKRRLAHGVEEHGSLTVPALAFLERELQETYSARLPAVLGPVLRTSYRRLTLAGRTDAERLTFDFELMFAAESDNYSIAPGRVLLETKTDVGGEAGKVADKALRRLGVRPIGSCSKYCLGVALARPEFPDNPFRPLIRHHFDASRRVVAPGSDVRPDAPPDVELEAESPQIGLTHFWREGTA
jgi:hypothetical protein